MIRKTLGYGLLVTAAVGFGVVTWYGRHSLVPGNPVTSTPTTQKPQAAGASARQGDSVRSSSETLPVAHTTAKPATQESLPPNQPLRPSTVEVEGERHPVRTYKPLAVPNDPLGSGWWVSQTKLAESWDIAPGSTQTILAVIDGGYALEHEEFSGRWAANNGESGVTTQQAASNHNCSDRNLPLTASCNLIDDNADGIIDNESGAALYENPSRLNCTDQNRALDKSCNRLDDDTNGHIDDLRGWDFINNDNAPLAGELNPTGEGTTHGTKVTGLAAATGNNNRGIAGVDWHTKILPIQAMDDDAYGDTLSVGRAIYYAIEQGADVISLSLGSELPDNYVRGAVQEALKQGIVVVAASGNDGCNCVLYPANYPEVLAVGALDTYSQVASFSSYGSSVDVLAPGVNVTSPTWRSGNAASAYETGLNGTSFATPLVAGTVSRLKSLQPNATPAQLIAAITENVNRLGLSAPHNLQYGFGTLDAAKSVRRMAIPETGQILYAFSPVSTGSSLVSGISYEPTSSDVVHVCDNGATPSIAIHELLKGSTHFFSLSKVEIQRGVAQGYSSSFLAYACLQQPHDTNSVMRNLNIFREFRNISPKQ